MDRLKWFDRKFVFSYTENIFPMILERLMGTPVRLTSKLRSIPPEILETRIDKSWSIKENIGHLNDLETLWQKRLASPAAQDTHANDGLVFICC